MSTLSILSPSTKDGECSADRAWAVGVTAATPFPIVPVERRKMSVHMFVWGILDRFVGGGMPLACMRGMKRPSLSPEWVEGRESARPPESEIVGFGHSRWDRLWRQIE